MHCLVQSGFSSSPFFLSSFPLSLPLFSLSLLPPPAPSFLKDPWRPRRDAASALLMCICTGPLSPSLSSLSLSLSPAFSLSSPRSLLPGPLTSAVTVDTVRAANVLRVRDLRGRQVGKQASRQGGREGQRGGGESESSGEAVY